MGKLEDAKAAYRKYLELSRNNCAARIRYASFLYIGKDYAGALSEIANLREKCDSTNVTLLRVAAFSYYETKEYVKGVEMIQRLFNKVAEDKRTVSDYEYYGKLMIAVNQDSLGAIALKKSLYDRAQPS
jgi:cytochrome c-type biogenesis protein CcmH/NrfG